MKIAAIVVTFNRKELLKENIKCLLEQNNENLDILIIDNNSTDGTYEYISDFMDKIHYYNTGENLGGAGGFSFGIKKAVEEKYDYLWIMDDDCMPTNNALNAFLEADEKLNGNYGFLSSKVLWKDESICTMNIQRRTLTKNLDDFSTNLTEIKMASFVSLFIKTDIVKKYGLPIKEFFIWTDDWEFTRRISKKNKCYFVSESVVVHKSKSNIPADISNDSIERIDRYFYLYRNDVVLYRKEGIKGFFYEIIRLNYHILKVLFKAKNHRFKRVSKIIVGTFKGLFFFPKIEKV